MSRITILGAGRVSHPCIAYLLSETDAQLEIVDQDPRLVRDVFGGNPRCTILQGDVREFTSAQARKADLVLSLLPFHLHQKVVETCLQAGVPVVVPSALSPDAAEVARLDQQARKRGLPVIMEVGLDPGIDHMLAVEFIREAESQGKTVTGFHSWCGGLPAPEANTNPLGYKFSWSPEGVVSASARPARYLREGQVVSVPGDQIMKRYSLKHIQGAGWFEEYPNGDSTRYVGPYGLTQAQDIYRASLRYSGWCETVVALQSLGLHDLNPIPFQGATLEAFFRQLTECPAGLDLGTHLQAFLGLPSYSSTLKKLEWLGVMSDEPLPPDGRSPGQVLAGLLGEKLRFMAGERDLVVMQHEFSVTGGDGVQKVAITYLDWGDPQGDSAMARGTGIPTAMAARRIIDGRFSEEGLHLPTHPALCPSILQELKEMGFEFQTRHLPPI